LKKLGGDIQEARKRRRIPVRVMADRALIAPGTLTKIERGDPGVGIGFYAAVLFVLGMADRLGEIVDASSDELGLALESEKLPQRVRWPRRAGPTSRDDSSA
jgi:transcriptional regulator with XRE-family HTH domain